MRVNISLTKTNINDRQHKAELYIYYTYEGFCQHFLWNESVILSAMTFPFMQMNREGGM